MSLDSYDFSFLTEEQQEEVRSAIEQEWNQELLTALSVPMSSTDGPQEWVDTDGEDEDRRRNYDSHETQSGTSRRIDHSTSSTSKSTSTSTDALDRCLKHWESIKQLREDLTNRRDELLNDCLRKQGTSTPGKARSGRNHHKRNQEGLTSTQPRKIRSWIRSATTTNAALKNEIERLSLQIEEAVDRNSQSRDG
ncbi:uncharacterized protein I303_107984 [Kwoniella dejecticola CBS 10117]|uniref:Uncharacterized protein n=1 Tax=Kwoniella dejecticola CBS 10117 TaxID=1296121 RepID=A0A1A5ZW82_9TREE|nr:uncharacterized protein I303_07976 [Kwoniella dejecticola CBS 10117]OBR82062.1 hypothetical protein I303_07976 [Kwoniella dejecticola CBS 10117]